MIEQGALPSEAWHALPPLVLSASIVMGSPGPSTISVTAVGAAFGFRRSLGYVSGLVAGTTTVLLGIAAGVVALLQALPQVAPVLVAASAAYILYLAFRIATAPPLAEAGANLSAPSFTGGFLLAVANPKAWFAITAVFTGTGVVDGAATLDAVVKTAVLTAMIVAIHIAWLLVGTSLARILRSPVGARAVHVALATLLVVTTAVQVGLLSF
ncbi:LysE family transporter [Chelatococcus sp. SYSU_G07232]|uniref:LysE family transporter n=1 Tax=Chelatococcus albus TaxID=3047466 RepID=A0ABT7AC85_9HYPH|nr:LysE family transporter [Chelatococcus sp. SYSU_G07232]MDJ1156976.1 LysE family transporter [Chelatococcus sp. SYSU_G07232]